MKVCLLQICISVHVYVCLSLCVYLTCSSAIILSPSSSSSEIAEAAIGGGVMGLGFTSGEDFGSGWDAVLLDSSSPSYETSYINNY